MVSLHSTFSLSCDAHADDTAVLCTAVLLLLYCYCCTVYIHCGSEKAYSLDGKAKSILDGDP